MKFKEGNAVEVFKRNEDRYGGWFPATVLSGNRDKYTVRYKLSLTVEGRHVIETVNDEDVRPQPPQLNVKESWITGDFAEALDQDSWWAGKIVKVLKNGCAVVKLFGSIQLKEFHTTNLRIPQAWRENQWIVTSKEKYEQVLYGYTTKNYGQLENSWNPALDQEDSNAKRPKRNHPHYSSVATTKRNLRECYEVEPNDFVKGTCKRRKRNVKEDGYHTEKAELPKKVDDISFPKISVTEKFLHMSSKVPKLKNAYIRNNKSSPNNHNLDKQAGHLLSKPVQVSEENIECSVASCSANQLQGQTIVENRHRLKNTDSKCLDDAISICPSVRNDNQSLSAEELAASIHELELQAYQTTMQALYASGPLSWEQESLLTNLRLCLNISNEEHLHHLRHMLSV